jgi:ribosome maturation factor RimP
LDALASIFPAIPASSMVDFLLAAYAGGPAGAWETALDLNALEERLTPIVAELGYEIVRLKLIGGSRRPTLQVMADRLDGTAMIVDDCARVSRAIDPVLDEIDAITGEYALEVSSPGIDRPLVRAKDYARWAGHEVRIELEKPVEGRKRFTGKLEGIDGDRVMVALVDAKVSFTLAEIASAKLVLTDALIEAAGGRG